jgi:uncharacterized protein (TIGR03435 family)
MSDVQRRLYSVALRMHPAEFRFEFGREMALDFEEALQFYGRGRLWRDVLWSLVRQWSAQMLTDASDPIAAPRASLLEGDYVMIRDKPFTALELLRGAVASGTLLALCAFGIDAGPRHATDRSVVYAASATPATGDSANPNEPLAVQAVPGSELKRSQTTVAGLAQNAPVQTTAPAAGPAMSAGCAIAASAQSQSPSELVLFHPAAPLPSYEVATIKLLKPDAAGSMVKLPPGDFLSLLSTRRYIMNAYGARYAEQVIGGPEWLNKDAYVIEGRPSDDLEAGLRKMTVRDRYDQTRSMMQCLFAERFQMKAHFETRMLPVYELVPAKGGLRITEAPAPQERKPGDPPILPDPGESLSPGTSRSTFSSDGLRVLNARAIKMDLLARIIGPDAGSGDHPVVNHTGFSACLDIKDLRYAPVGDATAGDQLDAPSLIGALEKNLGIKLVRGKGPIEVLVIDHIERPSEN